MNITIFSNQKADGERHELPIGRYKIADLPITNFENIKIPEGLEIVFYENQDCSGEQYRYPEDVKLSTSFYDKVASLEVKFIEIENEEYGIEYYPDEESHYRIRNKKTGKIFTSILALDIKDGIDLIQANWVNLSKTSDIPSLFSSSDQQLWKIVNLNNKHHRIIRKNSTQAIDVAGGAEKKEKPLHVYNTLHSGIHQQWRFWSSEHGYIKIQARGSGYYIDGSEYKIKQRAKKNDDAQKWKLERIRPNIDVDCYYKIIASHSGKVVAIAESGGAVIQTEWTGKDNQLWGFIKKGEDYYQIANKKSGKVLDVDGGSKEDGTAIIQWDAGSGDNQQWWISLLDDGNVRFVAKHSKKTLNVADNSLENGGKLIQWKWNGDRNAKFKLERHAPEIDVNSYYQIVNFRNNKGFTVSDDDNLVQYSWNRKYKQFWKFEPTDNGYYKIINKESNKVVTVSGASKDKKANVVQAMWDSENNEHQQWRLDFIDNNIDFIDNVKINTIRIVARHSGQVIDISGGNLQQYDWVPDFQPTADDQKWFLKKIEAEVDEDSYYRIVNEYDKQNEKVSKVLSVEDNSILNNSDIIHTIWNHENSQLWQFIPSSPGYYQVVNKKSKKVLKVGYSPRIIQWTSGNSSETEWKLEALEDGFVKIISRYDSDMYGTSGGYVTVNPWNNTNPKVYRKGLSESDLQVFKLEKTVLTVDSEFNYKISDYSNNLLTAEKVSTIDNNSNIISSANDGQSNQLWRFIPTKNGYYQIINKNSGNVITIEEGSSANVIQSKWDDNDEDKKNKQQWKVKELPNGDFNIVAFSNKDKVLSISDNNNLTIDDNKDNENQRFKFEKVTSEIEVKEIEVIDSNQVTTNVTEALTLGSLSLSNVDIPDLKAIQAKALALGGHQLRIVTPIDRQNSQKEDVKFFDSTNIAKELIASLKGKLNNATDENKKLSLSELLLGDFGVISNVVGNVVGNILDIFIEIKNTNIKLNESATKLTVTGEITLFSKKANIVLDFFVYKDKAQCSFRYDLVKNVSLISLIDTALNFNLGEITGLELSDVKFIATTNGTLFDADLGSEINQGVNIYADFHLKNSKSKVFQLLGGLLFLEKLSFHGAIDTSETLPFYLFEVSAIRGINIINFPFLRISYDRSDVAFELKKAKLSITMSSDIIVGFGNTLLVFTGGFKLEPPTTLSGFFTLNGTGKTQNGVLTEAIKKTQEWKNPFGIPGLTIRQFSAEVGCGYTFPWLTKVGIHGDLMIGSQEQNLDGRVSVLVDTTDPQNYVLAGETKEITILELMTVVSPITFAKYLLLPDKLKENFNKIIDVKLNDVKINIVPSSTSIGAVHFNDEGVTVKGKLTCWDWKASAYVNIDYTEGITVQGEMDPIKISDVLEITGAGGDENPKLYFRISPVEFPSLYISARVKLLFVETELKLVADENGFSFLFNHTFGDILAINLACSYANYNLTASGRFNFNLNVDITIPVIGVTIKLDTGFSADAKLAIGRSGFLLELNGSFYFNDTAISFPTLELNASPTDIKALCADVVNNIKDNAIETITELFPNLEEWVDAVKKGIINCYNIAVEEVTKILKTAYKKGIEEITNALKVAEYGINAIANGLTEVFDKIQDIAIKIGEALFKVFNIAESAVVGALKFAGYTIDVIGETIIHIYNVGAEVLAVALRFAGYGVNVIGQCFVNLGDTFQEWATEVLGWIDGVIGTISSWFGGLFGGKSEIELESPIGNFFRKIVNDAEFGKNTMFELYLLKEGDWLGFIELGRKNGFDFTVETLKRTLPEAFFYNEERNVNAGWHISTLEM